MGAHSIEGDMEDTVQSLTLEGRGGGRRKRQLRNVPEHRESTRRVPKLRNTGRGASSCNVLNSPCPLGERATPLKVSRGRPKPEPQVEGRGGHRKGSPRRDVGSEPQADDLNEVEGDPHPSRDNDALLGLETQSGSQTGGAKHREDQGEGREPLERTPYVASASTHDAAVVLLKDTGDPP